MLNDNQLQQAVLQELEWTPAVTSSHIGVTTNNGVVTLSGHVSSFWEKRAAEHAAQNVRGVKAVVEKIKVQLSSDATLSDEKIAELALANLASDVSIPNDKIKVEVENGWVMLSGEVDWNYQKIAADYCVHKIIGLVGLSNNITVAPHVQPYEVRAKIAKALERTAPFDVKNIIIKADGGKVTLGGEVENSYERDLVVGAAWAVPGVTHVKDHLNITWG